MEVVILLVKIFFVFNVIMGLSTICTWIERKGSALIQDRIGANRAGAFVSHPNPLINVLLFPIRIAGVLGLINTLLCDAVKALLKEDFVPEGTSQFMHCLAPFMAVAPVFLSFALIPFAPDFELWGHTIRMQIAAIDAGVLFIFAMGSVSVYGVAIAGWSGNNKFSLLGGLRAAAQMISYELAMGLAFVSIILMYGTLDLYSMVDQQKELWGVMRQPLAFVILFVVGMAETKRGPFDLPESESELVAGYFTEYSGMKFLLFWMGEFAEIALFSILITLLFFGGWHVFPFVDLSVVRSGMDWLGISDYWFSDLLWAGAGHLIFMSKVMFFCILQIVIRWTIPRFRYDQLMSLGWKILLPLAIVNLLVVAALKLAV